MTPSEEEVTKARRILEAMDQAAKVGKGGVALEGRLIDIASIRMAEALLTKANGKPVDMLGALFLARQSSRFLDLRRAVFLYFSELGEEDSMAWTTPVLVEICIGLEINGYLPADGYVPPEF